MEFGTKKAKKAIASKTVNAINTETAKGVEAAVLDSMKEASDALPVKEEQQESILESKPIPTPDLTAEKLEDVYDLKKLVPPGEMRNLAVKEWQDAVNAGQEVQLSSRFVAKRLRAVVSTEDVQKLKILKYLLLLLDFNSALQVGRGGGKKVPAKDKIMVKMSGWSEAMVESVRRRFAEGGSVNRKDMNVVQLLMAHSDINKWHMDNLMTHMAAISLYIDNWKTDTNDLKEDLRLEVKQ